MKTMNLVGSLKKIKIPIQILVVLSFLLILINVRPFFNQPTDILFYDRILIFLIVVYQLTSVFKKQKKISDKVNPICKIMPGVIVTSVAFLVFHSESLAIYGSILCVMGLLAVAKGSVMVQKCLPQMISLGIMTYPPRFIFDFFSEMLRAICFSISRWICKFTLPDAVFNQYWIQIGEQEIEFSLGCSGVHFFMTFAAIACLTTRFLPKLPSILGLLSLTLIIAIAANVGRVATILMLTDRGYGKEALFEYHTSIGELFILLGLMVLLVATKKASFLQSDLSFFRLMVQGKFIRSLRPMIGGMRKHVYRHSSSPN